MKWALTGSHLCKQWWVFWRSMPRSRCLDSDEKVWCIIGLGTRHRMQPPLPKQNFGNAVHGELVTSTARELIEHGLGWAGWRINNTIASKTTQEVRKYLDDWVKNPKVVNQSPLTSASLLILGSSPWFDMYGNDFGWGKPVAQRGSGHEFDGMLVVCPGKEEGSIDFEVSMLPETLDAMREDAEFKEAVAT